MKIFEKIRNLENIKYAIILFSAVSILTSCDTKIADMLEIMERSNIICVDSSATGTGTGENWENAYVSLTVAVANAEYGDEIWLADNYLHTDSFVDINVDIKIVGGFSGDEDVKSDRISNKYSTIDSSGSADNQIFSCNSNVMFERIDISNHLKSGSLILINSNSNVTFYNCRFVNNRNFSSDGVIFVQFGDSELVLKRCNFKNNSNIVDKGGVLHNDTGTGSKLEIYSCEFTGNSADANGGVLNIEAGLTVSIEDSSFIENHSGTGGAISHNNTSAMNISNTDFNGNYTHSSAFSEGGAIYSNGSGMINISDNCKFISNGKQGETLRTTNGGAIYIEGSSTLNIFDYCLFEDNQTNIGSSPGGGAIYISGSVSANIFNNCTFYKNKTDGSNNDNGGAIYITGGSLSVANNCSFIQNEGVRGGAIWCKNNSSINITDNCSFRNNLANDYGGAIVIEDDINSDSTISDTVFYNNTATNGGAISASNLISNDLIIKYCKFTGNNAVVSGDGLYFSNVSYQLIDNVFNDDNNI